MEEKTLEILELFELIAKPFKDREGGPKLDIIQEYLKDLNIKSEYEPGIGLIINKKENPEITVVSHMDLINKFQKGFENGTTFTIEEGYIKGALDNTLTNAVALVVFKDILNENPDKNIELFLSEGEEVGLIGISNYLEKYNKKSKNTFFINLDVTNDSWGYDISIEYDKPDFLTVKNIQEKLNELNINIQGQRFCDDTDAINSKNCKGFSFCIPTLKTIHSYKNKAKQSSIYPYYKGLKILTNSMNINHEEYNCFNKYNMDIALKEKNINSFNKNITKTNYSYQGKQQSFNFYEDISICKEDIKEKYNLNDYQLKERNSFISMLMDFFCIDSNYKIIDSIKLKNFLEEVIYKDTSFNLKDFLKNTNLTKEEFLEESKLLINEYGILLEEEKGVEYKFPNPDFLDF
jgi:hypothetical protein